MKFNLYLKFSDHVTFVAVYAFLIFEKLGIVKSMYFVIQILIFQYFCIFNKLQQLLQFLIPNDSKFRIKFCLIPSGQFTYAPYYLR